MAAAVSGLLLFVDFDGPELCLAETRRQKTSRVGRRPPSQSLFWNLVGHLDLGAAPRSHPFCQLEHWHGLDELLDRWRRYAVIRVDPLDLEVCMGMPDQNQSFEAGRGSESCGQCALRKATRRAS